MVARFPLQMVCSRGRQITVDCLNSNWLIVFVCQCVCVFVLNSVDLSVCVLDWLIASLNVYLFVSMPTRLCVFVHFYVHLHALYVLMNYLYPPLKVINASSPIDHNNNNIYINKYICMQKRHKLNERELKLKIICLNFLTKYLATSTAPNNEPKVMLMFVYIWPIFFTRYYTEFKPHFSV